MRVIRVSPIRIYAYAYTHIRICIVSFFLYRSLFLATGQSWKSFHYFEYAYTVYIDYFMVGECVRFLFTICEESQTNSESSSEWVCHSSQQVNKNRMHSDISAPKYTHNSRQPNMHIRVCIYTHTHIQICAYASLVCMSWPIVSSFLNRSLFLATGQSWKSFHYFEYACSVSIDYFMVGECVRFLFTSCEELQTNERVFERVSLLFFTTSE